VPSSGSELVIVLGLFGASVTPWVERGETLLATALPVCGLRPALGEAAG